MTQHDQIISYLKVHPEGLTTYEAFTNLGQTKLTSRISELRTEGYVFDEKWEMNGGKKWIRYKLISEPCKYQVERSGQLVLA